MRLIFSILMGLVVIAAALFFVGPLLISTDKLRSELFAQVEAATGYRLRVSGPIDLTLFPSLDLVVEDVGVARPASGDAAEFATAKKLRFGLMLGSLINGKVQMTELTLVDPVIALPETSTTKDEAAGKGEPGTGAGTTLQNLSLDKLVIENGTVILRGANGKPGKRIEALMLKASLPAIDAPLSFDLKASYDGKPIQAAGSIGSFRQFLEGAAAPVSLAFEAPAYIDQKGTLAGTAAYKGDSFVLSQFTAKAGDKYLAGNAIYKDGTLTVTQLAARAGDNTLAANAVYKDNVLTLNPLTVKASGTSLTGALSANLAGDVPNVAASLSAPTLDLNRLLSKGGDGTASAGASAGGGTAGWSEAPIDFSGLRAVNGKFSLAVGQVIYGNIKVSSAAINATLSGGKLVAEFPNLKLYNGTGNAALSADASGKTPKQAFRLSLTGFDAYPFLKDAAGFNNLEGKGSIAIDVTSNGASQRAMVSALNGTAKFEFADGAIRGMNIAKTMRSLTTGVVTGWQSADTEKTDFATLGASFAVAEGQARTEDLNLVGPLVRLTGAGVVNLPAQALKFRVEPRLVASLEGQGGETDLQGLRVPVIISGPWAKPKIYPDIKGILENPAQAYEQLKQLGGGLVSLPGLGNSGNTGSLPPIIQNGKVNKDALTQGALQGLGQLLNKKDKKKGHRAGGAADANANNNAAPAQADPGPDPQPNSGGAAQQLMQNFLGN